MSNSSDGDMLMPKLRSPEEFAAMRQKAAGVAGDVAGQFAGRFSGARGGPQGGMDMGMGGEEEPGAGGLAGRLGRIKDPLVREVMKSMYEVQLSKIAGKSIEIPDPATLQIRAMQNARDMRKLEEESATDYVKRVEGGLSELDDETLGRYNLRRSTDFFKENPKGAMAAAQQELGMNISPYTLHLGGRKLEDIGISFEEKRARKQKELGEDVQFAENVKKAPEIMDIAEQRFRQYEEKVEKQTGVNVSPFSVLGGGAELDSEAGAEQWASQIAGGFKSMATEGLGPTQLGQAFVKRYGSDIQDHLEEADVNDFKRITFNPDDPDSRAAFWQIAGLLSVAADTDRSLGEIFQDIGLEATSFEASGFEDMIDRVAEDKGITRDKLENEILGPSYKIGKRRELSLQKKADEPTRR